MTRLRLAAGYCALSLLPMFVVGFAAGAILFGADQAARSRVFDLTTGLLNVVNLVFFYYLFRRYAVPGGRLLLVLTVTGLGIDATVGTALLLLAVGVGVLGPTSPAWWLALLDAGLVTSLAWWAVLTRRSAGTACCVRSGSP